MIELRRAGALGQKAEAGVTNRHAGIIAAPAFTPGGALWVGWADGAVSEYPVKNE